MASEKVTWFYYVPDFGHTEADCNTIETSKHDDAEDVAAQVHEDTNVGDFAEDLDVMVSPDGKEWTKYSSHAELTYTYTASKAE